MKQVLIRNGEAYVDELPAPAATPGTVLVRVLNSCISSGTEGARLGGAASKSLVRRALEDPGKVKRAVEMALDRGIKSTMAAVRGATEFGGPTGYSVAGVIEEVGAGVTDLRVGERVACAGAGLAFHAEFVAVPRNLCVRIPAEVSDEEAASVTIGAIALHGVRRLEPTMGEWFVVVGLGLLGQLTVQMLRANGCRVIGMDLSPERVELARSLGMDAAVLPGEPDAKDKVLRLTDGYGADGVVVTAGTSSSELISVAFGLCRPKGRVVVVGAVGLDLKREDIFPKELEFRISTSYGPGRYDQRYEDAGLDYPIGYVRWTENRNMEEYLRMVRDRKIKIGPLVQAVFPIDDASSAFESVGGAQKAPMVLLSYPRNAGSHSAAVDRLVPLRAATVEGKTRLAVIGAGAFTRSVHLPNVQRLSDKLVIEAVVNRTGTSAKRIAEQYGAAYAATDYQEVLADANIDGVLIGTRHNLHAEITLAALQAGKHVLVEKPLATTAEQLREIERFYDGAGAAGGPVLLTGFNRRFSDYALKIRQRLSERIDPAVLLYRMNAGYVPMDSWLQTEEGAGRNIGEACHIYDLFLYLLDSRVVDVRADAIIPRTSHHTRSDNFSATLTFEDGSVATLVYTALGHRTLGKERLEVFVDGKSAVLDDYRELQWHGIEEPGLRTKSAEKGHMQELEAFAKAIRGEAEWPIPLRQQIEAMRISFEVEKAWNSAFELPSVGSEVAHA